MSSRDNSRLSHAPATTADVLDHLAAAANAVVTYGDSEAASYFCRVLTEADRLAFDAFLVRMNDPLAFEAGTCEHRFRTRVVRMAQQFVERKQSLEARS